MKKLSGQVIGLVVGASSIGEGLHSYRVGMGVFLIAAVIMGALSEIEEKIK